MLVLLHAVLLLEVNYKTTVHHLGTTSFSQLVWQILQSVIVPTNTMRICWRGRARTLTVLPWLTPPSQSPLSFMHTMKIQAVVWGSSLVSWPSSSFLTLTAVSDILKEKNIMYYDPGITHYTRLQHQAGPARNFSDVKKNGKAYVRHTGMLSQVDIWICRERSKL